MRIAVILLAITAICGPAAAQSARTPRFSQYPAVVEKPRVKSINFKRDRESAAFRTRLSEALRRGVNFAGRYALAGWGCGTGCVSGAIIDTRTGKVYWPEQLNAMGIGTWRGDYEAKAIDYKKNSRLLILRGTPGIERDDAPERPAGEYFLEWTGTRLRQIKFIPHP